MLILALFVFHVLVGCAQAQFIQRWTWQLAPDANGNLVPTPFWRRETNLPLRRVKIPQTDVILEYNCHKLPAICHNVQNWENDATKSQWPRRQAGWFTVDFGSSVQQRWPGYGKNPTRANIRRDLQCPKSWKGTVLAPRCPETNQEAVVPAWVDATGNPITAIVPQDLTNPLKSAYLEIMYKQTGNNALTRRRSGRVYSCDEFPPASWVEGGVGTPGQNNPEGDGGDGTTRCAPYGHRCAGRKVGSEQDWQGQGHILLNTRLKAHFVMNGLPRPTNNDGVAFRFRLLPAAQGAAQQQATRIYYLDAAGSQQHTGSGGFRRRSGDWVSHPSTNATAIEKLEFADNFSTDDLVDMGWVYDDVIAATNDTDAMIHMSNGQVIPAEDTVAVAAAVEATIIDASAATSLKNPSLGELPGGTSGLEFAAMSPESSPQNVTNSIEPEVSKFNSTASRANDSSSTTYDLETQRQPKVGVIDIISLSEQYILGQLGSNYTTNGTAPSANASITDNGPSSRIRRSLHGQGVMHRHRLSEKRQATTPIVEGPIQCGPGKPCLDGSCCNSDGKCGYKSHNCGEKCISNCDAKAMCGIDSADGQTECGLKLCCSYYGWCGTESVHCKDPEPQFGKTPCQAGYGSCEMKDSPVCGAGSGTAKGRRVGYYQGWNTRERQCDKVSPRQINTRGLTHLFYSFAFFNPTTFEIEPMNSGDIPLYGEFTSLKRNGLQTWIAIGGWSFNDPGATETAYSDMVSTQANRAAFINSLIRFMDLYGFQGADIDWEYPAEPKRGGRKADTDNLVLLMKEMHAAFAGRYGSSLTIAPDYWYLRGFKPAAMQDYVDFLGFMSYDLHGPWDEDVKTLGSIVRPQTDITEIDKNLKPLWFDGVNPSKINFGIAYYGRTYKLSDPSCDKMGCRFVGGQGGAAGSCTAFPGVLSNREIRRIIKDEGITPYFNTTAMVKYFKYAGDSWVGYDDAETYALKEEYANNRCLGGIMIWSIDFDDETGGGIGLDNPNNFKSPESATIIPMSHTTVPAGQTFTVGSGASTDIPRLPNGGNQNSPQGPGADKCSQCSFFRRITSTCCGTGGSVANPILIPAGVPTPMDIPLPAGFTPNQSFQDASGNTVPANKPLPQETIIPRGTVFTQPFLIAPGTSLREGEGDDQNSNSSSLVWLSPDIWNDPNPNVQCFFPCTLVLPPWPSFTSTIDYPRITVTESGSIKTTLTFPPLTVSRWEPETIVINDQGSCTTSCTDTDNRLRTSSVKVSTTTTWPPVTYYDNGERKTTYPPPPGPEETGGGGGGGGKPPCPWPFCPGPPPPIKLPSLTISNGPPKPTVPPCAFPALTCLPPGTNPSPPGGTGAPDPNTPIGPEPDDPDPEDEVDEDDLTCALDPDDPDAGGEDGGNDEGGTTTITVTPGGGTTTRTTTIFTTPPITTPRTTTTVFTTVTPPQPKKSPDFSKDQVKCYDSGQVANRAKLISTADGWCKSSKNKKLESKYYSGELRAPFSCCDTRDEVVPVEVKYSVEVHDGCEWTVDEATCKAEFRKVIDGCDRNTEARKQGGRLVGDCMTWRIDPNAQT